MSTSGVKSKSGEVNSRDCEVLPSSFRLEEGSRHWNNHPFSASWTRPGSLSQIYTSLYLSRTSLPWWIISYPDVPLLFWTHYGNNSHYSPTRFGIFSSTPNPTKSRIVSQRIICFKSTSLAVEKFLNFTASLLAPWATIMVAEGMTAVLAIVDANLDFFLMDRSTARQHFWG